MGPNLFRPILTKCDPSKKILFPTMGHFNHEDELYNVTMAKFYSPFRPVGLRPAGRFLSLWEELWDKTASCVGCRGPPSI